MNELNTESKEQTASPAPSGHIARRRLLRAGMAAAPLMLAVSGRSAMATNTGKPVGLSPMAWNSVAPKGAYVGTSHNVQSNPGGLGKSPGFWKPNPNGLTFPAPKWPVAPFDSVMSLVNGLMVAKPWDNGNDFGSFRNVAAADPGFANGVKFNSVFAGGDSRSFSRIFLDPNDTTNSLGLRHFSAAYLNTLAFPNYAITLTELQTLYSSRTLVPGGTVLSVSQIKDFLDQTW